MVMQPEDTTHRKHDVRMWGGNVREHTMKNSDSTATPRNKAVLSTDDDERGN